eukprot:589379-Amphidinium_carterae.1
MQKGANIKTIATKYRKDGTNHSVCGFHLLESHQVGTWIFLRSREGDQYFLVWDSRDTLVGLWMLSLLSLSPTRQLRPLPAAHKYEQSAASPPPVPKK